MAKRIVKKAKVKAKTKPKVKPKLKSKPKTVAKKVKVVAKKKPVAKKKVIKVMPKKTSKPVKKIAKPIKKPAPAPVKTKAKPAAKPMVKNIKKVPIFHEDYMNTEQQGHFREMLLTWKRQLLGEMERTVHHMQDEAANFPDPNDRATQEEEFSLELRTRDRERKLIKKIDEALQRLDTNDYGYCEACGVEIGVQRLEARPTATLCIDCKTIDEIREKHFS